jgi:hypothetical protein
MYFPEKNSRGRLILQTLRRGPMTVWQGIEQHGYFVTEARPNGVKYEDILYLYCQLVERGCLLRDGLKYRLSSAASNKLDQLNAIPRITTIAAPREFDIWKAPGPGHPNRLTGRTTRVDFIQLPKPATNPATNPNKANHETA